VPHKRVEAVVRAVAALRDDVPGLHLDIVGRGPDREAVAASVRQLGLDDAITLHGYLSDEEMDDVQGGCGLHVCASDVEGWGQVVIDAAAHGIPTLGRDVPGLRDSIIDGDTGWLVDTTGLDDLAAELPAVLAHRVRTAITVLSDAAEQGAYAQRCRAWAARFTWDRMHDEAVAATVAARAGQSLPVSATRS
jgi:glycosyltransferase involved in cell wall biosynthesis